MLQLEVLIFKLLAVDASAAGAVAVREVTTLDHEAGDDAVEGASLVAVALLAGAQRAKVRTRLGADVAAQLESDAASTTVPDADLEVHLLPRHVSKLASALATSVQLFVL